MIGVIGVMFDLVSLEVCDNGIGIVNFDLMFVDDIVNGGNGEIVVWFEDMVVSM